MKTQPGHLEMPRGRSILFRVLALSITVVGMVGAGEVMVRLMVPSETFWPISNIYQRSDVPGVFYTYKPNFNGVAFGVGLKTNSLGFRGPEWSKEKEPGTFRIGLLGDSYAFGYGVPFGESVGEVLATTLAERLGTAVETLNFGIGGFNTAQQRAVLEHLAWGYDPDLFVLLPVPNDHEDAMKADREGWLHWDANEANPESRQADKSIGPPPSWAQRSRLVLYLLLVKKRRELRAQAAGETYVPEDPNFNWMAPITPGPVSARLSKTVRPHLGAMLTQIKARDVQVIVASFAAAPDYRRLMYTLEREHDVPVVHLLTLFPEARSWQELQAKFGLGWDTHLNSEAHRRFAEGIANAIQAHGYIPNGSRLED